MTTIEQLMELNTLNECAYECSRQSRWKERTQQYICNMLIKNIQLRNDVLNGKYSVDPTTDFTLNERGHIRKIEAPAMKDRVVQKTLMKSVLTPSLRPYLIYDNYASLKKRGTTFARKRFEIMLRRYINKNGIDGYVLMIDIKKYFESINHSVLKHLLSTKIANEPKDVVNLIYYIIDTSSHSDKGLNLGSEAPQIFAVYYLNPIDVFIKVVKGVKYYGRYMDDVYIIGKTKNELKVLLEEIKERLKYLKLQINDRKTSIIKLKHGFNFLQIKYNVLSTGKILKRISHKKIVRERRRLKAFKRELDKGNMLEENILNCYRSWKGTVIKDHNACYKTIHNMDILYSSLFPNSKPFIRKGRKQLFADIFRTADTEDLKNIFV